MNTPKISRNHKVQNIDTFHPGGHGLFKTWLYKQKNKM